jgi:hypothetical protein
MTSFVFVIQIDMIYRYISMQLVPIKIKIMNIGPERTIRLT